LLHPMSSCVRRLRSYRPSLSVFGPLVAPSSAPGEASPPRREAKRQMGNGLDASDSGRSRGRDRTVKIDALQSVVAEANPALTDATYAAQAVR
jgi:hypothetical protein